MSLSKFRQGTPITMQNGILFATYATLRSGARNDKASRLQQICDWLGSDFDGVILFDEAHALAGAGGGEKSERGSSAPSKQGVAGFGIAKPCAIGAGGLCLGDWGIVGQCAGLCFAFGALGATEHHLCYAQGFRFGDGDAGGVAAAEIVARDLKVLGLYNARSLSYEGVEVDILASPLNDKQKGIYDEWAGAFQLSIIIWKPHWKAPASLILKGRPAIKAPKPPRVLPLKAPSNVSSAIY